MKKLILKMGDEEIALPKDSVTATYAIAKDRDCPHCKVPLKVAGSGRKIGGHDFYVAQAGCINCGNHVGEIRAYVDTLFGLEEDERVARMGVRIY